jgi:glutamyl-tRNA reductase
VLVVVGLSHRTAPIEVRERLALAGAELDDALSRLLGVDGLDETMVVSTCNRFEVYGATTGTDHGREAAAESIRSVLADIGGPDVLGHLQTATELEAIRHLFRVASSLDSLVVGEPHILGQFKEAVRRAERSRALGPELHAAVQCALHVAKRVRSETAVGAGRASIPSVAITLARQIFDDLQGRHALLVGAGEMAETAARNLAHAGAKVRVVNRSGERAERLARKVGGKPWPWSRLDDGMVRADIVITSTSSPTHVITRDALKAVRRARRGRSLFFIDIAVPRDVDPAVHDLDNVYLYDIDDLTQVVAQTLGDRAAEARRAETIVRAEAEQFEQRHAQRAMDPVIVGLRERTRRTLEAELDRSLRGRLKHIGPEEREALSVMLDAAVNKLLHAPTTRLKAAAHRPAGQGYAQALSHLFALNDGATDEQETDEQETDDEPERPNSEPRLKDGARQDEESTAARTERAR